MLRHALIAGADGFLGSHLAAGRLLSPRDPGEVVHCAPGPGRLALTRAERLALLRHALRRMAPGEEPERLEEQLRARVRWLEPGARPGPELALRDAWLVAYGPAGGPGERAAWVGTWLDALAGRAAEVAFVSPAGDPGEWPEVRRWGARHRIFRPSLVAGEAAPVRGPDREGLLQLLAPLHELTRELEDRWPEYFDYQALRLPAPAGGRVNVIRVEEAAAELLRLAGREDTLGGPHDVAAATDLPFADLCEQLGAAYGLGVLAVDGGAALTAVDRLLQARVGQLAPSPGGRGARALAAPAPGWLEAIRAAQDAALTAEHRRAESLWDALEPRVVEAGGAPLTYRAAGSGDVPVIVLGAYGLGLRAWGRLAERLSRWRRVIAWEPRGTGPTPRPFTLADQVDDVEAVLAAEGAPRCHLVGWCTGPRVAMELSLRRPGAVASMAFLNPSFKSAGGSPELDTDYERHFEPLCRMIDRRPPLVPSVMSALRSGASEAAEDLADEADPEALAARVLQRRSRELAEEVLAPYRTEASTLRYARQILELWSSDPRARAGEVRAPVLVVTAEHDRVASPASARQVAPLFPDVRLAQVRGATHYVLHDRAPLVADLLESFFEDPARRPALGGELEWTP